MELLTAPTPNGWKVTILLEELREAGHPLAETVKCLLMGSIPEYRPGTEQDLIE